MIANPGEDVNVSHRLLAAPHSEVALERRRAFDPFVLPTLMRAVDLALLILSGSLAMRLVGVAGPEAFARDVFAVTLVAVVYLERAGAAGLYETAALMRPVSRLDGILLALATAVAAVAAVVYGFGVADRSQPFVALWFFGVAFVALAASRLAAFKLLDRLSRRGVIGRNLVVLGSDEQARRFLRRLAQTNPYFVKVVGVFDDRAERAPDRVEGYPVLGGLDDLLRHARDRRIDDVVVALPWNADHRVVDIVERLKELPLHVYLSSDLVGFELTFRAALGHTAELPMFEVAEKPISGWRAVLKTVEDYVLATAALVLIAPLLLVIAVAIKIDTPGPVFFMQQRLGFNNKPFAIFKFRSMHHQAAPEGTVRQAKRGDPRVTRVGRFIRATSLDELPQLLNVLNGTMSLVGPRPHALSHNEEYGRQIRGYFARHKVKPGITGWAQVNGLRGETEALELMEARVRHDVYYADNWSLFLDIRILVMTVLTVFFHKTAY